MKNSLLILLISTFALCGCQTSMLKEFESLTPGMEKDDVLDHMGSPVTTLRRQGKDRWFYVFYQDNLRFEKEIQFFEGKVIYVGDLWQLPPEQQASAVDAKNQIGTEESRKTLQRDYQKYMDETNGGNKPAIKYVPVFETIQ
ncbi:MAG: outer membrane protein assembly factor BamE [Bdellovibrionota bacterium]